METGRRGDPIYSNIYGSIRVDNAEQFLASDQKKSLP